jgi:hypothetical protein
VRAGEWTDAEYTVPAPATLRGRVCGSWQEMRQRFGLYDRPTIGFFSDDSTLVTYVETSDTGDFELRTSLGMALRLGIDLAGMMWWVGGATFRDATRFELSPGAEITVPDVVESGVIFHLQGEGERVPRAGEFRLSVYDAGGALLSARAARSSPASGDNVIWVSNLGSGAYLFRLAGDDDCTSPWLSTWYPGGAAPDSATPVRIDEPGQVVELDWSIHLGGEIAWVLEGSGTSALGEYTAKLSAASDSSAVICGSFRWNGGEKAMQRGLEDGEYTLAAYQYRNGRWRKWWYPGVSRHADAEPIVLRDHARLDLGTWRIPE